MTSGTAVLTADPATELHAVLDRFADYPVDRVGDNTGIATDWARARGEAFCELIEHLPTEHLHPKTAATLIVRIDETTLRGALKVAGLDTGADLSAGEALRLACNSSIMPAVLNGAGKALHLGRSARLFNEPQRLAKSLEYEHCAADGCERPYAWCELHHKVHWAHDGETNLDDAVPLCHFHHQRIHDAAYTHAYAGDGSITFQRVRSGLAGALVGS